MFCNNCGNKLPPGAAFCHGCGNDLRAAASAGQAGHTGPTRQPAMGMRGGAGEQIGRFARAGQGVAARIGTKKILIGAGALVVLVVLIAVLASGGGGVSSNPEKAVAQTVERFGTDLENCFDFSLLIAGGKLDFSPLQKYFGSNEAYGFIKDLEDELNGLFAPLRYLNTAGDVAGSVAGGLLGNVPLVGETLGDLAESEIKNDPIFDERLWKNVASIRVTPSRIVIGEDKQSAELQLDVTIKIDLRAFSDSRILSLSGALPAGEVLEETVSFAAAMEKQPSGAWVFVAMH